METIVKGMDGIEEAAAIIRQGGLVAFPTETVYGLGGNALDPEASKRIYAAKGRPSDNPLIVHVADMEGVRPLVSAVPEKAEKLMRAFWPGPLTIILPRAETVPLETTGGLNTVAVRCPENKLTLAFIKAAGLPIAGPSANTSGKPSPTEALHVYHDLNGKIDMILDDGPVGIGVESTIIDLTGEKPTLLRPGAVTLEELEAVLQEKVEIDPAIIAGGVQEGIRPKAPGMKYRHYAPSGEMMLVTTEPMKALDYEGSEDMLQNEYHRVANYIAGETEIAVKEGHRVGILCCEESRSQYRVRYGGQPVKLQVLGSRKDPLSMTHNLFRLLRQFDQDGVDMIFAESYSDRGVGFALMNRLRKAAGMREIVIE